jgi:hypothetical protein
MEGTGPVQDVSAVGIESGLSEDWYSDEDSRGEIKKGDFWDVIDNPLYQVAAEAKGYDWDEWIEEAKGLVGTGPNDGTVRVRATVVRGRAAGTETVRGPGGSSYQRDVPATTAQYEWMTRDEAEEQGLDYQKSVPRRWRNKETGDVIVGAPNENNSNLKTRLMYEKEFGSEPGTSSTRTTANAAWGSLFLRSRVKDDWGDIYEEARDWGVGDAGVTEDLDKISSYLVDIVNVNDHLHPIIAEGPKGEHYGIEGDIWEHYGLDKEAEPPKEMEWDSYDKKMNLATTVKSKVTYSTPGGIAPVDLHGD